MGADSSGLDGDTSTTSHFVGFRLSPLSTANLHTVSICSCKVARELLMVRISSAWMKALAYVPPTDGPNPLLCRDFRRGSMISKKRAGERTEPWRTPRSRLTLMIRSRSPSPYTLETYTNFVSASRPCHRFQLHTGVLEERNTGWSQTPSVSHKNTGIYTFSQCCEYTDRTSKVENIASPQETPLRYAV